MNARFVATGLSALLCAAVLAPACAVSTVELDENTAIVEAPLTPRIPPLTVGGPPKSLAPVLTVPPRWYEECASNAQKPPTYIVRVNTTDGTCPIVSAGAASWWGCPLFADTSTGYCKYTWTSTTAPAPLQYHALESVAMVGSHPTISLLENETPLIMADCSPTVAPCAPPPRAASTTAPRPWAPRPGHPPCDVCGFIADGKLTAVLPPWAIGRSDVLVLAGTGTWKVLPPNGASTFTTPTLTTTLDGAEDSERLIVRW